VEGDGEQEKSSKGGEDEEGREESISGGSEEGSGDAELGEDEEEDSSGSEGGEDEEDDMRPRDRRMAQLVDDLINGSGSGGSAEY
jgi:hypothetical protein